MTRGEFLDAASKSIGYRVPTHTLRYAMDVGLVTRPNRSGGHYDYTPRHMDEFLCFLQRPSCRRRAMGSIDPTCIEPACNDANSIAGLVREYVAARNRGDVGTQQECVARLSVLGLRLGSSL